LFLLFVSLESCSLDSLQGIVGRGRSKLSHKLEEDRRVRVMRGIGISCGQYDSMVRSSQSTKVRVSKIAKKSVIERTTHLHQAPGLLPGLESL
jgi:hypothetical protein